MEIFGNVAAILDDTLLVIKSERPLTVGYELTVFAALQNENLTQIGMNALYLPKGDVRIILQQPDEGSYVAERFQEMTITKKRRSSSAWLNPLAEAFEEVEVVQKGAWSADFDESQKLKVTFEKVIQIGDPVGKK